MEFTLVMLIFLTLALAYTVLAKQDGEERSAKEEAQRRAEREEYYNQLAIKYRADQEIRYAQRKDRDFTGEHPLTAGELEAVKAEVMR